MFEWFAKFKTKPWLKWPSIIAAVFVILLFLSVAANLFINSIYQEKILPQVRIGDIDVAGLDYQQARDVLSKQIDFINRHGFVYNNPQKSVVIYPNVASVESPDSPYSLVDWDIDQSLNKIFDWQTDKSWIQFWSKLKTISIGRDFPIAYQWDREQHLEILEASFIDLLTPKQEADFEIINNQVKIIPEEAGRTFDYQIALQATQQQIERIYPQEINLQVIEDPPLITTEIISSLEDEILGLTNRGGHFYLTFQEKDWAVPANNWQAWLQAKTDPTGYYIGFDKDKFQQYLVDGQILKSIETPVQDARFEIIDGKVSEFVSSHAGRSLNLDDSLVILETILNNPGELEAELIVEIIEPQLSNADVNDLGILEIIGIGESDFSGSPRNRVHNIGVGADTLNGVLIAPDEEFSLIGALGEIDGEHGYLEELVIKGNETIPEFGGGLCQIGTTTFRGALASGLPITQRRNHSYRVSYYEPAGTDATIYNPWPDFRFTNDTGKHILIQTRIEGVKLYFDFWGTKDGRQVSMTDPIIYNIVPPPEKKIIKTIDLPVGEEKCTERAHNGADAKFDYSVHYLDAEEPEVITFYSHYVPWQEVCLIGVTEEEYLLDQASSTPEDL